MPGNSGRSASARRANPQGHSTAGRLGRSTNSAAWVIQEFVAGGGRDEFQHEESRSLEFGSGRDVAGVKRSVGSLYRSSNVFHAPIRQITFDSENKGESPRRQTLASRGKWVGRLIATGCGADTVTVSPAGNRPLVAAGTCGRERPRGADIGCQSLVGGLNRVADAASRPADASSEASVGARTSKLNEVRGRGARAAPHVLVGWFRCARRRLRPATAPGAAWPNSNRCRIQLQTLNEVNPRIREIGRRGSNEADITYFDHGAG